MWSRNPEKEWEKFGSKEPYYGGGINKEKFRRDKIDDSSLEELFASGQEHMEFILKTIRQVFNPGFAPARMLDFGCGVGRCVIPMAKFFPEIVGADISNGVLEEARKISAKRSLNNVKFYKSDDSLQSIPGKFDLIHSTFVFQHIIPERGLKVFQGLIDKLTDTGFGAVGFLFHRNISSSVKLLGSMRKWVPGSNYIANLLEKKPIAEPYVEKNVYQINDVLRVLLDNKCSSVHSNIFRNGRHLDAMLFFQKNQSRVPHELFYNK